MIEPGDVIVSTWKPDQSPLPVPPEPNIFEGPPKYLDRPSSEPKTYYVGDWYEFSIRMKGERPITIKFEQANIYGGGGNWTMIKSFQLVKDQIGFTVKFPLKYGNAGRLQLQYVANNSKPGAVIRRQELIVKHKQQKYPGG